MMRPPVTPSWTTRNVTIVSAQNVIHILHRTGGGHQVEGARQDLSLRWYKL